MWDPKALIQKETHPGDPPGTDAISDYPLEAFAGASLVEVRLRPGRRNQIRMQARLRGHTLVGEQRYIFGPGDLRPIAVRASGAARPAPRVPRIRPTAGR